MSQLLNGLQIVEKIPENLEQRESVINRAIDIRSACMVYLAEHLSHWITADDHASFLSGYQAISTKVNLPGLEGKRSTEIANAVLSWLGRQPSWLLVIDNLDDFKVAEGLLPENAPGKHTLITTRNPLYGRDFRRAI